MRRASVPFLTTNPPRFLPSVAGAQQVAALEYRSLDFLHAAGGAAAGCKVCVTNAEVRDGLLLLTPDSCHLLGGHVPRLEAARQRLLQHWDRPTGWGRVCGG